MASIDNLDFFNGRLKLRHLVIVIAIYDTGSTVAAAAQLLVSQPVITRLLSEVERTLGAPLFERTPHGMAPLSYTAAFVDEARLALSYIRQAGRNVRAAGEGISGEVYVGVHHYGASEVLIQAIAQMATEAPQVTVHVKEATPGRLQQQLVDGALDLLLTRANSVPVAPRLHETVEFQALYCTEACVVASPHHPVFSTVGNAAAENPAPEKPAAADAATTGNAASDKATVDNPAADANEATSLSELMDYPWVLPTQESALYGEVEEVFSAAGLTLPDNHVTCSNPAVIRGLLQRSQFLAVVPNLVFVQPDFAARVPVRDFEIRDHSGVSTLASRALSPAAARFKQMLVRASREQVHNPLKNRDS